MADDICFNGLPELDFDAAAHYGIPNQRKGIRRFQYQNGTYTPAGNERYRPKTGPRRDGYSRDRQDDGHQEPKPSLGRRIWNRTKKEPGIIAKNIVKKHIPVFALKDDELRNINERLMLEESVLHLSGRLSPQDHRRTTHSVFTSLLNVGVHTLDSAFTTAAKTAFSSHGGGGGSKDSDPTKYEKVTTTLEFDDSGKNPIPVKSVVEKHKKVKHDGLDEDVIFTCLPDLEQLELLKSLSILDVRV